MIDECDDFESCEKICKDSIYYGISKQKIHIDKIKIQSFSYSDFKNKYIY